MKTVNVNEKYEVNGVTLEEFLTYMKTRNYSKAYITNLKRMFIRIAKKDPTIEKSKSSKYKKNQVLHHIRSYKLYYHRFINTPQPHQCSLMNTNF